MFSVVIYCGDVALCVIIVYHGRRGGDDLVVFVPPRRAEGMTWW